MWKKILLTVVAVLVAGGALMLYGTYKAVNEAVKDKEPQLRQYVQLDEAAQNKYIVDNFTELLNGIDLDKDGKPEDQEKLERLKQANTNPDIQKALVDAGRSFMASAVLMSEAVSNDLSADVKAKYQQESAQLETRLDKYGKLLEAAGIK